MLYPDACGGGGRGWISQGIASYGRGHGTRETCALHTARLSCDTLVDFWSALGGETRHSLLRMKEEDFIERLMYRYVFDEYFVNLSKILHSKTMWYIMVVCLSHILEKCEFKPIMLCHIYTLLDMKDSGGLVTCVFWVGI